MKKILTIALAIVFALSLSATSTGLMFDDGPVVNDDGEVVGYSYGGLYWDADEYAALSCVSYEKQFVTVSKDASDITGYSDVLTDEDVTIVNEVAYQLGMAIAAGVDEDGNMITLLGGYTFVEEEGTSLGKLMNRLETWAMNKSPYQDMFFSRNLTYKAVKAADGEQMIDIDIENAVIEFYVNETVDELGLWDTLVALRYAVAASAEASK